MLSSSLWGEIHAGWVLDRTSQKKNETSAGPRRMGTQFMGFCGIEVSYWTDAFMGFVVVCFKSWLHHVLVV